MFFLFFSDAKSDCWKGSGRGFADVMDRTLTEVQGGAGLGELVTYYQVLHLHTGDNKFKNNSIRSIRYSAMFENISFTHMPQPFLARSCQPLLGCSDAVPRSLEGMSPDGANGNGLPKYGGWGGS